MPVLDPGLCLIRISSWVLRRIDWRKNVKGALILLSASELGIVVYAIVVRATWLLETRVSELQNQQSVNVGMAEPLWVVMVILLPFVLASALVFYKSPGKELNSGFQARLGLEQASICFEAHGMIATDLSSR